MLWLQGWNLAPRIVEQCRRSWLHHNPNWTIHFLSRDNLNEYINVNEFSTIFKEVPPQTESNIIRIHLLRAHGGVWIDATCFCCKPLDEWVHSYADSGFFAFNRPRKHRMMASWFLASRPDNLIIDLWCQKVRDYWLNHPLNWFRHPNLRVIESRKKFFLLFRVLGLRIFFTHYPELWYHPLIVKGLRTYPYFWFHCLFEHCYRKDARFRKIWDATTKVDANIPVRINRAGFLSPLTADMKRDILNRETPLYKLSHRRAVDEIPKGSILYQLLRTLPPEHILEQYRDLN